MKSSLKIVWKTKIVFLLSKPLLLFFKQKYILFLETYFLKIPRNLIVSAFFFFFAEVDTKKYRYASANASNAVLVKLTDWIIKNDRVINCALFFCKWYTWPKKQCWLSTAWLLIFRLEVANKQPYSQSLLVHELKFPVKKI